MSITLCAVPGTRFATITGTGIPHGFVRLSGTLANGNPCERDKELMTEEEARAEGLRQGLLTEFRETTEFRQLLKSTMERYGEERFLYYCDREEVDPNEMKEELGL